MITAGVNVLECTTAEDALSIYVVMLVFSLELKVQ